VVMVVVMIVVMVMMIVIMVMMIMIMVIMIMVIVFVVVMMHVGRHDTCQADWVMWMVGTVTAAHSIVPRQEPRRASLRRDQLSRQQQKRRCYWTWMFPPKAVPATSLVKHCSRQFSVGRLCRACAGQDTGELHVGRSGCCTEFASSRE
jgi:hypothetical protein